MIGKIKYILRKIFPNLIAKIIMVKDALPVNREPMETPQGFKLIGHKHMESGIFEPGETKIFSKIMSSVDLVINVGANIGYYSCIALKHNKKVVAFEPITRNVNYLLKNIRANGWQKNIEIFPIALGKEIGIIEMFGGGTGASVIQGWSGTHQSHVQLIPCSTMDSVLGDRFEDESFLIMVDIEGAEKILLEGSNIILNMDTKPIWLMEISISVNQPKGQRINPDLMFVFNEFWSRGYEVWTTHSEYRIVKKKEVQAIIDGGNDTLWGDTFLFFDRERYGNTEVVKYLDSLA